MELLSIQLARVAAFIEIASLDPEGRFTPQEGIGMLTKRYGFLTQPKELSDINLQEGVTYASGRMADIAISMLRIFSNGLAVDTRSSTDDSLAVLEDIIQIAKDTTGITLHPYRRHLVSQIVFRSDLKLSLLHPALQPIASRLSRQTSEVLRYPINYEPIALQIGPDSTQLKIAPSNFSLERRSETPFNENTYFSMAPLSTSEHIELIRQLEGSLFG